MIGSPPGPMQDYALTVDRFLDHGAKWHGDAGVITADPAGHDAEIERNEADQKVAGHWGVPLMVFRGEPFFGQDRIDVLRWRMQKAGLARRVPG